MRLVIIILSIFLVACDSGIDPDSKLLNRWQWVSSSGGFAGTVQTPSTTGEEITIEFSSKKYKKFVNGSLTEDLRYKVKLEESIFSTEDEEIINYSNGWRQSYLIRNDTLFLSDQCYDCFGHIYIRE